MLILVLLGMYFDAAVVFVTSQTLFLRFALAILCWSEPFLQTIKSKKNTYTIVISAFTAVHIPAPTTGSTIIELTTHGGLSPKLVSTNKHAPWLIL